MTSNLARRSCLSLVISLGLCAVAAAPAEAGNRVARALKGRLILSRTPFPASFSSDRAFIRHMKKVHKKGFWYKGQETMGIEFMAFFAKPVVATKFTVTIYDITEGRMSKGEPTEIYPAGHSTQIIAGYFQLNKEEFEPNRKYHAVMTKNYGGPVLAEATFVIGKEK